MLIYVVESIFKWSGYIFGIIQLDLWNIPEQKMQTKTTNVILKYEEENVNSLFETWVLVGIWTCR